MDERAVNELRRLADVDHDLSVRASALTELDRQVVALRARAEAIDAFFSAYPEEEARRGAELREAQEELDRRRQELSDAERALAEAHEDESRAHAEHSVARARDHIAVTASRIERAQAAYDALERDAGALPRELDELKDQARAVPDVPQLSDSLVEWASRARAELFVAVGQIDVQRERAIREANELASMLLGEPTYGSTIAQALARVEGFARSQTRNQ